jgi:superfamily I DNA/RNA helicase
MKAGIAAQSVEKNAPLEIDGRKVHIVTAHSSKGLGFPIVFVPEVSDDTYPARTMMARAKDAEQEEQIEDQERRLLYVALSRASHQLTMLTDETRPSRFLDDLNRSSDWAS